MARRPACEPPAAAGRVTASSATIGCVSESPTGLLVEPTVARQLLVPARGAAAAAVAISIACFAVLAVWVHDTRVPKGIDTAMVNWLVRHVGAVVQQTTIAVTDPVLTVGTCTTVAVVCLLIKRRDVAALAVFGPLAGLFLESYVLKPSINRLFVARDVSSGVVTSGYAFPSGHQTGVTSAAVLLTVLVLHAAWSRRAKTVAVAMLALWTAIGALALVRSGFQGRE